MSYPVSGAGRAGKMLREKPSIAVVTSIVVELLRKEEGIMWDSKIRHLLRCNPEVLEIQKKNAIVVIQAIRYGAHLGYFERVENVENWYPETYRLPGITRTKPKSKYLGLDVD